MTEAILCNACGRPLSRDGLDGVCAPCMLKLVVEGDADVDLAPPKTTPLTAVSGYEIGEEIARGGMGIVYRAVQAQPRRVVALKMLLPHQLTSPGVVERFHLEARAIAALDHPAILPVYEVGEHRGLPFFTMKLATGGTLADRQAEFAGDFQRIANLMKTLADAVQFAHERGVLHRDLKPGNVLFDEAGRAYISDFGLAKLVDHDTQLTRSMELLGTPAYVAPEVAAHSAKNATTSSDIYSLGAILYQLLAGRPPFAAEGIPALLKKILEEEPAPPLCSARATAFARRASGRGRELEIICLKCLSKSPAQRYSSAGELARDLGRFLRDEPIHARPAGAAEKLWRWCRRNPALGLSFFVLAFVFVAGLAGIVTQWRRAERAGAELRENLYAADMKLAHLAWESGNLGRATELLRQHRPAPGEPDLRGFEWRLLWKLCQGDEIATLRGHRLAVSCVAFSPDGTLLATASHDATVRIWNVQTRETLRTLSGFSGAFGFGAIAFSPDGRWFAAKDGHTIVLFDTHEWQEQRRLAGRSASALVNALTFTPDNRLLVASSDRGIQAWSTSHWTPVALNLSYTNDTRLLSFFEGDRFAVSNGDQITLLDLHDPAFTSRLEGGLANTWSLAIAPDHARMVAGFADGHASMWDLSTAGPVHTWPAHALFTFALAFSPDGSVLASGGGDQLIRLWQVRGSEPVREGRILKGHRDQVWCLAYSPLGNLIASGSQDATARLWSLEEKPVAHSSSNIVGQLWFSPPNRTMSTLRGDLVLRQFDAASFEETNAIGLPLDPAQVVSRAVSSDGTRLVFLLHDGSCEVFDSANGHRLATHHLHRGPYGSIALAADHQTLAIESRTGDEIEIWDLATAAKRFECKETGAPMVFLNKGRYLASSAAEFTVKLWDTVARREVATFRGHKRWITALAVSPDDSLLASASIDGSARLWDVRSGQEIGTLRGHLAGVESIAFSPDGRTLATGGYDATLRLWSVATRKEMITLQQTNLAVAPVQFSPDGSILAAASVAPDARDPRTRWRLWRVPSLKETDAAVTAPRANATDRSSLRRADKSATVKR